MIVSLQVAAIAGLMAVASTPVMAQTTGTPPAQPPSYGVAPPPSQPPTANQFSSNEIIDAGHRFFGGVSRGLAEIVEKAVSQWGQPNGYVLPLRLAAGCRPASSSAHRQRQHRNRHSALARTPARHRHFLYRACRRRSAGHRQRHRSPLDPEHSRSVGPTGSPLSGLSRQFTCPVSSRLSRT